MAAWMGTSKSWRGMSWRSLLGHAPAVGVGLGAVHDGREGVDRHVVDEQVDPHQVGRGVAGRLVVEAGVALGPALQLVEEVHHHLGQGDPVDELEALGGQVLHRGHLAALGLAQLHDRAGVLGGVRMVAVSMGSSMWSIRLASGSSVGLSKSTHRPVGQVGPVGDRGGGGDQREVELALEALADDLHVQAGRGSRSGNRSRAPGTTRARR